MDRSTVYKCSPSTHRKRTCTGCIRGSYVGALWGLLFHRYDVKPLPEDASRARMLAHTLRIRAGEPSATPW